MVGVTTVDLICVAQNTAIIKKNLVHVSFINHNSVATIKTSINTKRKFAIPFASVDFTNNNKK